MRKGFWGLVLGAILGAAPLAAAPAQREVAPVFLEKGPVLRGDLGDPLWEKAKLPEGTWMTYNPLRGDPFPQRTEVYLAYDPERIYVGFRCHDTQPDQIKASLAKRDDMWSDDWVGLSLDTFGTHHSAIHLFVNPLGIQADALDSVNGGEDPSPDYVWESRAQRQPDGYTVEVAIPLKSIRFQGGKDVRMGILFWRRIARLGISGSWPAMPSGQWVYQNHLPLRFPTLSAPLRLEVLPSVTASRQEEQVAPGQWERTSKTSLGIGVKVGLTSAVTADLTYKPDFSQVESDAFQSEVNQRYPIFYSEKRPFFMESMGIFSLGGTNNDTNMQVPVHTRRIMDPLWGAKVTGDSGPVSFGVLASSDRAPGAVWEGEKNPDEGRRATYAIGRALYGFGQASYVGAIYSGREFNGTYNRVGGLDFTYNPDGRHSFTGNVLQTRSTQAGGGAATEGEGHLLSYSYNTRPLNAQVTLEHYGRDFRMDTAFYNRTGIDQATLYVGPSFYPKAAWAPWLHTVNPFVFAYAIKDNVTGLTDYLALAAVRFTTNGGGNLRLDIQRIREGWKGELLTRTVYRATGGVWVTKWLNLGGSLRYSRDIYYDAAVPFQGPTSSQSFNTTLQPSDELKFTLDLNHIRMKDPVTGAQVFDAKVLNTQLTYQFNSYFFLRATCRNDTWTRRMLTDYLASFTYIPGTVIFLGYGQVFEKVEWQDDQWMKRGNRFEPVQRGLFFKVSYNWRA